MQAHDPAHDSLLERVIVGDLPRDAAPAMAQLAACAQCRERLAEFDELQARLERAGEEERAGVAQAAAGEASAKDKRRIEEFVRTRVSSQDSGSRAPRWIALALAASLAGVIAARVFWPPSSPGAAIEQPDVLLSDEKEELRGVTPKGKTHAFESFTWISPQLKAGEVYRLTITNAADTTAEPLVIANIERAEWRWADVGAMQARSVAEFLAKEPQEIEWVVEIWDVGKRVQRSLPVSAWR